jgi:hypothetical protein
VAILVVLALPDELGVEVRVARVEEGLWCHGVGGKFAEFSGGEVGACLVVLIVLNCDRLAGFLRRHRIRPRMLQLLEE